MSGNLYLTGFMGAGKTTVGRALAGLLRRRFVDMDERLARRLGMSIPQVFAELGEDAFRQAESRELRRLARQGGLVVATGGGLVERAANREVMRASGSILHLDASLDTCRRRLGAEVEGRPLWRDQAAVAALYERRRPAYAECDLSLKVDGRGPEEVAQSAAVKLLGEERFRAVLDGRECPILATGQAPQRLTEFIAGRRVALLTDSNLARLHLERYRQEMDPVAEVVVPPGERSKSLRSAERVYQALLQAQVERGDLLVIVGGGVVTDLGAFVAATFKRGMDFVLCSTSLVGCVDAAIGGKAAVNLAGAKNQVGCFTRPRAVILDLAALATLPRRAVLDGLVEAYKTGLVADPALAALMEEHLGGLMRGEVLGLARVVARAARAKAEVVSQDFREAGRRRILNLGHTYGHALESHNRYRVGHGRAVAAGMMVAVEISRARGLLDDDTSGRLQAVLQTLARGKLAWPTAEEAWPVMQNDKKNQGGRVVFVLVQGVGQPLVVDDLTRQELQAALQRVGSR